MPDEIDLNDEEEAALEAAWESMSKEDLPEDEQPTDEYEELQAPADEPLKVKPSPFKKE